MKAWSAALAGELETWPKVTARSFFGFTALYRGKLIFGMLPRTRSVGRGDAVAFKLRAPGAKMLVSLQQDPQIHAFGSARSKWRRYEIATERDLNAVLHWFGEAFEAARRAR